MAEYIKREDAFSVACAECEAETFYDIPSKIEAIPSADVVERKHGRDICDTVKGQHCEFKCSVCGAWIGCVEGGTLDGGKFKFCPNCGAELENYSQLPSYKECIEWLRKEAVSD